MTTVEQFGGMRDTLRMGNTQPRVTFAEIIKSPNAYAVGALPNLDGEITIFDGNVWIATTDGKFATTSRPDVLYDSATLLTSTHVHEWVEFDLPNLPLESAIETIATMHDGIDSTKPFPFLVIGDAVEFQMHVIHGYCPVATPNLADEYKPWRLALRTSTPITVVGFFAKNQEGVMTHHGSQIHMHCFIEKEGGVATGHLDSVQLKKGATLYLPAS